MLLGLLIDATSYNIRSLPFIKTKQFQFIVLSIFKNVKYINNLQNTTGILLARLYDAFKNRIQDNFISLEQALVQKQILYFWF